MNKQSADQDPVLQVFPRDKPEAPKPYSSFHLTDRGPIVTFHRQVSEGSLVRYVNGQVQSAQL